MQIKDNQMNLRSKKTDQQEKGPHMESQESAESLPKTDTQSPREGQVAERESRGWLGFDQLMNQDSFRDFDEADMRALKTRDQVPFTVRDLPDGGQVRERIYKTPDDQGRVFERDFRHEKDFGDQGRSKVFHSYREYRSNPPQAQEQPEQKEQLEAQKEKPQAKDQEMKDDEAEKQRAKSQEETRQMRPWGGPMRGFFDWDEEDPFEMFPFSRSRHAPSRFDTMEDDMRRMRREFDLMQSRMDRMFGGGFGGGFFPRF